MSKQKILNLIRFFLFSLLFIMLFPAINHANQINDSKEKIIKRMIGFRQFEDADSKAIFSVRYNYNFTQNDISRLINAGYPKKVVDDIIAISKYTHKQGPQPLKGEYIESGVAGKFLARGGAKDGVSWEIIRIFSMVDNWDEAVDLVLVNQTGHKVNLTSVELQNCKKVKSSPLKNGFYAQSKTLKYRNRFGGIYFMKQLETLSPHKGKIDATRWDNWQDFRSFIGNSYVFKRSIPYISAGSTRAVDYVFHTGPNYGIRCDDDSGPMEFSFTYKYVWTDNNGIVQPEKTVYGKFIGTPKPPEEEDASVEEDPHYPSEEEEAKCDMESFERDLSKALQRGDTKVMIKLYQEVISCMKSSNNSNDPQQQQIIAQFESLLEIMQRSVK
ncbi:MAG: hypothetical protein KAJ62_06750 [Desulfobacteraceae bacterium]|nr:hypothetical protein [Desulfobacteraceae bacterium]